MAVDPRVAMLAQMSGGGGGGGGGMPMPQGGGGGGMPGGMPLGGGGGGGGLEQLMQLAGPLLQNMGPNSKMQLGQMLQTPGVQQMIQQVMSNPQMMQQIMAMAGGGGGGGMPPGGGYPGNASAPGVIPGQPSGGGVGGGPTTDGDINNAVVQNEGMMRKGLPPANKGEGDYAVPDDPDYQGQPQSTEQELQMLQQMMNRARG